MIYIQSTSILLFILLLSISHISCNGLRSSSLKMAIQLPNIPKFIAIGGFCLSSAITQNPIPSLASAKLVGDFATSGIIFKDTLKISSIQDPKLPSMVLYLSDFDRPINEKLSGNLFDDPSSSSLSCAQVGNVLPSQLKDISDNIAGEEIFEESRNLFFKQIRIRRVYDKSTNTIIYVSYNTRLNKDDDTNKSRYKSSLCAVHINNQ